MVPVKVLLQNDQASATINTSRVLIIIRGVFF